MLVQLKLMLLAQPKLMRLAPQQVMQTYQILSCCPLVWLALPPHVQLSLQRLGLQPRLELRPDMVSNLPLPLKLKKSPELRQELVSNLQLPLSQVMPVPLACQLVALKEPPHYE